MGGHKPWQKSSASESPTDTCQICGKPIRGKAERFSDVHGALYHLGCYQTHAGEVPDEVCRICKQGFASEKERVKDVVGFYYHRKCYHEELERQRLAASGAQPEAPPTPETKEASQPVPDDAGDEWNLTPDPDDDWELAVEVDDGWMRPDPDELEVKGAPQPPPSVPKLNLPAKPVEKPATNPLKRKSESKSRAAASGVDAVEERRPARQATPPPRSKPKVAPAGSDSSREPGEKASPSPSSKAPSPSKAAKPDSQPKATARAQPARAKAKPLRRAKPIEKAPHAPLPATPVGKPPEAAGLPEGLELLPEGLDSLPEGLELLPEGPEETTVDGLEFLDDVPVVPTRSIPAPTANSSFGTLDELDSLDGLEPLDGLVPLDGTPVPSGGVVQGVLVDPQTNQPAVMGPRRASSNSIPTWLWVVMGIGVGVVVIMLVASVVSVMWTKERNKQPLASAEVSEPTEISEPAEAKREDSDNHRQLFVPDPAESVDSGGRSQHSVAREPEESPERGRLTGADRPRTRLDIYRLMLKGIGDMGSVEFGIFLFFFCVSFSLGLAFQALALRIACKMCEEGELPWGTAMQICGVQAIAMFLSSFLTIALDMSVAWKIDIPMNLAICVAIIQIMIPTSTGRAILIMVCQFVVGLILAVVIVVALIIGVPTLIAVFR